MRERSFPRTALPVGIRHARRNEALNQPDATLFLRKPEACAEDGFQRLSPFGPLEEDPVRRNPDSWRKLRFSFLFDNVRAVVLTREQKEPFLPHREQKRAGNEFRTSPDEGRFVSPGAAALDFDPGRDAFRHSSESAFMRMRSRRFASSSPPGKPIAASRSPASRPPSTAFLMSAAI